RQLSARWPRSGHNQELALRRALDKLQTGPTRQSACDMLKKWSVNETCLLRPNDWLRQVRPLDAQRPHPRLAARSARTQGRAPTILWIRDHSPMAARCLVKSWSRPVLASTIISSSVPNENGAASAVPWISTYAALSVMTTLTSTSARESSR